MVSTTHSWKKTSAWLLATCCLLATPGLAAAEATPFQFEAVNIHRDDDGIGVEAAIDFTLNETVLEALHNGVPLTVETQLRLERVRNWMWDDEVATHNRRLRLHYFALSQLYLVSDESDPAGQRSFLSLAAALHHLGHFSVQLADRHQVLSGQTHTLRMRVFLDIESLPAPLRPLAYLSSRWRLKSPWQTWTLAP